MNISKKNITKTIFLPFILGFGPLAHAGIYSVVANKIFDQTGFIGRTMNAEYQVTNTGGNSVAFPIMISYSADQDNFPAGMAIASDSTCQNGTPLSIGQSCTLKLQFAPAAVGTYSGGPVISYKHLYGSMPDPGQRINVTVYPAPQNAIKFVESESSENLYSFTQDASLHSRLNKLFDFFKSNKRTPSSTKASGTSSKTVDAFSVGKLTIQNMSNLGVGGFSGSFSALEDGNVSFINDSGDTMNCLRGDFVLAPGATCHFKFRYTASSTPLDDQLKIQGYPVTLTVNYSGETAPLTFPFSAYHVNKGYFLALPENTALYRELPDVNVLKVFIDSNDRIYAATPQGLAIGGYNSNGDAKIYFTVKTTANGLSSNKINDIFADSNGTIYVATDNGLNISTDNGASFNKKLTGKVIKSIFSINSGGKVYVFAATDGSGLAISADGGNNFIYRTHSSDAHSLIYDHVNGVYSDGQKVYVATANGISVSSSLSCDSFTNIQRGVGLPNQLGSNGVNAVYVYNNKLYAATAPYDATDSGGVSISDDLTNLSADIKFTTKTTFNNLGSNDVKNVLVKDGTIYASTTGGLSISRTPSQDGSFDFDNYTPNNTPGLNSDSILGTAFDHLGNLYIASALTAANWNNQNLKGGLAIRRASDKSFYTVGSNNDIGSNLVKSIYIDTSENIYVAMRPQDTFPYAIGGLSISTDGGASFVTKTKNDNGLGSNDVREAVVANDSYGNRIYLATAGGLSISTDLSGNHFDTYNQANRRLANDSTNGVFVAANGNELYVANQGKDSDNRGLSLLERTNITHDFENENLGGHQVNSFYSLSRTGESGYEATASEGLWVWLGGNYIYQRTTQNGLGSMSVKKMVINEETSQLLAATSPLVSDPSHPGGLSVSNNRFDQNVTFDNFTAQNEGLASNDVRDVFLSQCGAFEDYCVYLATYPIDTLSGGLSYARFPLVKGSHQWINKNIADGLGSNSINTIFTTRYWYNNVVYVGTEGGLYASVIATP